MYVQPVNHCNTVVLQVQTCEIYFSNPKFTLYNMDYLFLIQTVLLYSPLWYSAFIMSLKRIQKNSNLKSMCSENTQRIFLHLQCFS